MDTTTPVRYVEQAGVRIAYRDLGDPSAAPVILLHGLFRNSSTWNDLAARLLTAGRRVVLMDLRGHGHSAKASSYRFADFEADLTAVLDDLGLDQVDLVGHSLGGHAATRLAQLQPGRVRRLVVEDAPPPPVKGDPYRGPGLGVLPPKARVLVVALLPVVLLRPKWRRHVDLTLARAVLTEFRRRDPQWWERLRDITAPTLVISGGSRSHVPPRRLEDMCATIPKCHLVTIEVGHRVHLDAPDEFARVVLPFLS